MRVAIKNAKGGLDPNTAGNFTALFSNNLHFDTLLQVDNDSRRTVPNMVSFERVDETNAVLRLNPGITFHDGEPVTAEDVKFSIDRVGGIGAYNPDGTYDTGGAYTVASIAEPPEVVDDLTVNLFLKADATALASLGGVRVLPKHFIEEVGDDEFNRVGLGSGPFKIESFTPDTEVVSSRFDDYFQGYEFAPNKHIPWVKELRQIVQPEPLAQVAAMEAGEVDVLVAMASELVQRFVGRDEFTVLYDQGLPHNIYPNTRVPTLPDGSNPFTDIRVRMAMNHAIDVETLVQTLGTGQEIRAYGLGSLQRGAMTPAQKSALTFDYDPEKAKALMAEAGYADGFEVDFYGTTGFQAITDPVALSVQQYLEAIGIRTRLKLEPLPDFRARFATKEAPGLFYYFANQNPDPVSVLNAEVAEDGTLTTAYYPETTLQEKLEAVRGEFDEPTQTELIASLAEELYTNASWLFLFENVDVSVIRSNLEWNINGGYRQGNGGMWAIRPLVT